MAIGQLLLFSSASTFKLDVPFATNLMWGGLVFLILGNGFFKPNISSMVGQLYKKGDSRLDAAFTIFYMGINTGAMLGMLICPWLGDVKVDGVRVIEAFKWGFLAAGAAMLIGTILFILLKGVFLKAPDGSEIGLAPTFSAIKSADKETEKAEFSTQSIVISSALFIGLIIGFHYLFVTEVANPIKDWIYPVIYSADSR